MRACLDTTVLIDFASPPSGPPCRAAREAVVRVREHGEVLATTRMNVAELLVGVSRSRDPVAERRMAEALLRPLSVLEFDANAAQVFGRNVAHLDLRGTPISDMDALIAAVCLASGHSLITRNPRHFSRVPGLTVESY